MASARRVALPASIASVVQMATINAPTDILTRPLKPLANQRSQAGRILDVLIKHHGGNVNIPELRLSSGFANESRIDLWTIDPSPANGNRAIAYEIKISRRDWRKESKVKQRGARLFADCFYYATPPGLLKPEEIPDWAGLVEVDDKVNTIIVAPKLDKAYPTWGLVVSMLRRTAIEV